VLKSNKYDWVWIKNPKLENAIWLPLVNPKIIISFLKAFLTKIALWIILGTIACYSRNLWVFIKNLMVLPKGIFISKMIQKKNITHIHAHWGSTTATMAYIISRVTDISWSFTLHGWDIKENNMLKEKLRSANFVRCISKHSKNELLETIDEEYKKIKVIRMGSRLASYSVHPKEKDRHEQFHKVERPAEPGALRHSGNPKRFGHDFCTKTDCPF